MTYRRTIFLALLIAVPLLCPSSSQAKRTRSEQILARQIRFIVRAARMPRSVIAVQVYSRRLHRNIYRSNARLLAHPASNLKIITTAFALDSLGADYKFKTFFSYSGKICGDTLDGDLIVKGGGDPILSDSDLTIVADSIKKKGVSVVNGRLIVDVSKFDSLEWGEGWMWDDEPEPFAMFVTPASVDHNVVTATVAVDSLTGTLVISLAPHSNFVDIVNRAVKGGMDSLQITRKMIAGRNTIVATGVYSDTFARHEYQFSVRKPSHFFGSVFEDALQMAGVELRGELVVTRDSTTIPRSTSLYVFQNSMDTVITYTNKESDNLGAECLLRLTAADKFGETGSARNGINHETEFLESCGIDSSQHYIVDGSGVSHYNLITPEAVVHVLKLMLDAPDTVRKIFLRSLPIGGVDGTLYDRMKFDTTARAVLAKTGSINSVSTLSGYILTRSDTLVFSIMFESYLGNTKPVRDIQDELCNVLFHYDRNPVVFSRSLRKDRLGTYSTLPLKKPLRQKDTSRNHPG